MSPIGLSGLASGLDTDAIITQLMSVERQPRTRMALQDTQAKPRQDWLGALTSKLDRLNAAATALGTTSTWAQVQPITSSDPTRVGARAVDGVPPGTHTVDVTQVATATQRTFTYTKSLATETISIGSFSLAVDPGTEVGSLAAAINARDDAPVRAVVAGGELVLTNRSTGAGDMVVTAPPAMLAEDPLRPVRQGVDATYSIDGGAALHSSSNVIRTDATPGGVLGLELTLKAATTPGTPITITAGDAAVDTDAAKSKVSAFVTAYNDTIDFIRDKLAEKPVPNASTNGDIVKGLFFGDRMLTGMLASMRSQIGDLSDLGISTGAASGTAKPSDDAVAGHLTVDATKLATALSTGATSVGTRLKGLGDRMTTATSTGSASPVSARQASETATRKRLADGMAAMDVRLATKEKRLRAQFSAMESALAAAQAAQSQMSAQLSALG